MNTQNIAAAQLMSAKNLNWTVAELLEAGECTAQCLCATDPTSIHTCSCPCRGVFHGQLANKEVSESGEFMSIDRSNDGSVTYWRDGDTWYAWDRNRSHILGEGDTIQAARADLERITALAIDAGLDDYEYSGSYVYTDSFEEVTA